MKDPRKVTPAEFAIIEVLWAHARDLPVSAVKEELAQLQVDARHDSIPKNWLYEVEEEPITSGPPASASQNAAADDDDQDDREGRNPLYFEDEDKDNP